jgi:Fe-Mn family superoxide dismutase
MKKVIFFLSAISLAVSGIAVEPEIPRSDVSKPQSPKSPFKARDFSSLLGMEGFSDEALRLHFKLYEGYVKNTNLLNDLISQLSADGKDRSPPYAEMKRRLMWEYDGMRLHELYFENLGGKNVVLDTSSALYKKIVSDFSSYDKWKADFVATGAMRGIGWSILYLDPISGKLTNAWINEHDVGHLAGGTPLLIMDVFEHAYLLDYGIDRAKYIDAFFNNINWAVAAQRYPEQK